MKPKLCTISLVLFLILMTGCLSADPNRTHASQRSDSNLISQQQIEALNLSNAYDIVERLKSTWLRTRGVDSFMNPTQVQVYLDNSRLGGIDTLKTISSINIAFIRYYPHQDASLRWGLDHSQGVIFVSSRSD